MKWRAFSRTPQWVRLSEWLGLLFTHYIAFELEQTLDPTLQGCSTLAPAPRTPRYFLVLRLGAKGLFLETSAVY
jgi:hypothetical protein